MNRNKSIISILFLFVISLSISYSKVLVIYTGGTIGSEETSKGLDTVSLNRFNEISREVSSDKYIQIVKRDEDTNKLKKSSLHIMANGAKEIIDFDMVQSPELLDSSNMQPKEWAELAKEIISNIKSGENYNGVVVLHGTDTLAWSSSALSYIISIIDQNLNVRSVLDRPIIVTGSQYPLSYMLPQNNKKSDALKNLARSIYVADTAKENLPEVAVVFSNEIYRGNRVVKVETNNYDAFNSPNLKPLGRFKSNETNNNDYILGQIGSEDLEKPLLPSIGYQSIFKDAFTRNALLHLIDSYIEKSNEFDIISTSLFPGIQSTNVIDNLIKNIEDGENIKGIILLTYGSGNGPSDENFLDKLATLHFTHDVSIIDITQVISGTVDIDHYATGSGLKRAGVASGYNLTIPAALSKAKFILWFILASRATIDPKDVYNFMQTSVLGDLDKNMSPTWQKFYPSYYVH